ncbi:UNVERIFIED_CONTAM: rasp [Trichonephila clavipes]
MPCSDLRMHADNSDVEWLILTSTFKKFYMLFLFQVICTNIILRVNRTITPFFYTVFSVISLSLIIGYAAAAVFIFYPSLIKSLCYMMTICALFFIHHPLFNFIRVNIPMGDSESFLFDVGIAWLILKSLSFAIDRIDSKKTSCGMSIFTDIFCVLSYSLYLPVLFTGPIITYETFCNQMLKTAQPLPLKELIHRFLLLVRHILWYFVYEFLLHYIYSHAVQFYPDAVQNYDSFALCGLGYALPKMFFLKYYIIYGVSKCISKLEDIELPPPPKCISCVHLSSELWRHFDRGLYLWILKYLYLPAGGARVHDGGITPLGPLLLIMYCGCHVSISWKEHQQNSKPVIMYNKSTHR